MNRFAGLALVLGVGLFASSEALAHFELVEPGLLSRGYGKLAIKDGPCGVTDGARGDNVYTFEAGSTVSLVWDEYIPHPGHYRISLDLDGDDDFVDPQSKDDRFTNEAVLEDGILGDASGLFTYELELPDVECDNCTLQVIQVMTDKMGNGWGNDEFYYQCVNLILTKPAAVPGDGSVEPGDTEDDPGAGDDETTEPDTGGAAASPSSDSGGCSIATSTDRRRGPGSAAGLLAALLGAAVARRQRKR
jgi:hypothetical protein